MPLAWPAHPALCLSSKLFRSVLEMARATFVFRPSVRGGSHSGSRLHQAKPREASKPGLNSAGIAEPKSEELKRAAALAGVKSRNPPTRTALKKFSNLFVPSEL